MKQIKYLQRPDCLNEIQKQKATDVYFTNKKRKFFKHLTIKKYSINQNPKCQFHSAHSGAIILIVLLSERSQSWQREKFNQNVNVGHKLGHMHSTKPHLPHTNLANLPIFRPYIVCQFHEKFNNQGNTDFAFHTYLIQSPKGKSQTDSHDFGVHSP